MITAAIIIGSLAFLLATENLLRPWLFPRQAIIYACVRSNLKQVEWLLHRKPDLARVTLKRTRTSLLHLLCIRPERKPNAVEIMRLLIAHGADVNAKDKSGRTPLHVAAWWNDPSITEVLLFAGADRYALDMTGRPPQLPKHI